MDTKSHRTPIKRKTPNSLRTKRFYERIASARADKIDRNRLLSMAALELQMMREDNTISLEEALFLEQELEREKNDIIEQEEEWIQAMIQDYDQREMAQEACLSCPNGKLAPFLNQWKCTNCGLVVSNVILIHSSIRLPFFNSNKRSIHKIVLAN